MTPGSAATKAWVRANPEKRRAIQARYRTKNKVAIAARTAAQRKTKHTAARLAAAGRPAPDRCEVCGGVEGPRMRAMHFDHCHTTGSFRGWLCARCNMTLGQVKDNPDLLIKLAEYLKRARENDHAYQ